MAPKMKSAPMMKSAVMTKGALTKALAEKCEVKNGVVSTLLSTLASIATAEAKKNGKFVIPGVVMIKTGQKRPPRPGNTRSSAKSYHVSQTVRSPWQWIDGETPSMYGSGKGHRRNDEMGLWRKL